MSSSPDVPKNNFCVQNSNSYDRIVKEPKLKNEPVMINKVIMVSSIAGNLFNLTWLQRFAEYITQNLDAEGNYTVHLNATFTIEFSVSSMGFIKAHIYNNKNDKVYSIWIQKDSKEGTVYLLNTQEPFVNFKLESHDTNDIEYVNTTDGFMNAICPIDEETGMWLNAVLIIDNEVLIFQLSSHSLELRGTADLIKFGFDHTHPVINDPSNDVNHAVTLIQVP